MAETAIQQGATQESYNIPPQDMLFLDILAEIHITKILGEPIATPTNNEKSDRIHTHQH